MARPPTLGPQWANWPARWTVPITQVNGVRNKVVFLLLLLLNVAASAAGIGPMPMSLRGLVPPVSSGLLDGPEPVIVDRAKAIALGKALFWDVAVGSDGMACASCHFHAGADGRRRHQMAPGGADADATVFDSAPDGQTRGPNYTLRRRDFPLIEPTDALQSPAAYGLRRSSDDVVGSSGTFGGAFASVELAGSATDNCARQADAVFHVSGTGARAVTARNAPSVINAAFNHRNFWDGRANNTFNGSSPWGARDPAAGVWVKSVTGSVSFERMQLANASLASQALAAAQNATEMSCAARSMAMLGRKLLLRRPLAVQEVHSEDSILGPYAYSGAATVQKGLRTFYLTLVRQAFNPKYWSSTQRGPFGAPPPATAGESPLPFSQAEANFGMFFALALQVYQSTLISDDAPIDRSRRDAQGLPIDLTPAQLRGLDAFRTAHCNVCHVGPLFTAAAVTTNAALLPSHPLGFGDQAFKVSASSNVVDRGRGISGAGLVDSGFAAIGVTRTEWDRGLGGHDPFGHPYAYARQFLQLLAGNPAAVVDSVVHEVRPCDLTLALARDVATRSPNQFTRVDGIRTQSQSLSGCFNPGGAFLPTVSAAARELENGASRKLLDIVEGAFKIPGLRNVELTGPYMHNGGMATLAEVVEFYARGGNFDEGAKQFGLVFPQPDLQLDARTRADLLAFLTSLTDERVRYERAPFDHPQLPLLHGHQGDHRTMSAGNPLAATLAKDRLETIPAVGAAGRATPLMPFADSLQP